MKPLILGAVLLIGSGCAPSQNTDKITSPDAALALACMGCHTGESGAIPALELQSAKSLEALLTDYKNSSGDTVMHLLMRGYSDAEIKALAEHFGSDDD